MSHVTPLSLSKECIVHYCIMFLSCLVILPSPLSCRLMFKGDLKKFYLCSLHSLCVSIFESVIWLLHTYNSRTIFRVSCHRCGTHHGPPSMRPFLSTLAHHLGNSLRNKNLVPWDLYALMTDSLALDIDSHHWPLIDRIDWVFDIRTSIHTQYIVLGYLGNHWHQWWYPSHLLTAHIIDINGDLPHTC